MSTLNSISAMLSQVYNSLGAGDAWQLKRYESGHAETPGMRSKIMAFLEKWL